MIRELILPNWHVIFLHYPLGLFMTGLVIELGRFIWRGSSIRTAGRWMILLGGLSMIPTALSGLYALESLAEHGQTWAEKVDNSSLTSDQWRQLLLHTWVMSGATALVVLAVVSYLAASDRLREKLYWLMLALLLIGAGAMATGAWFAGEAVYRFGAAVQSVAPTAATQEDAPPTVLAKIDKAVPLMQPHVIMAGFAIAMALAAVGVSVRRITGDVLPLPLANEGDALVQSLNPPPPPAIVYPAKFWLTTMALFIATALLGWIFLANDRGAVHLKVLWLLVAPSEDNGGLMTNRRFAHVITAGALVLLPLLMAALGKWAPKQKAVLAISTLLLLIALGIQLWLGVLLLFDGTNGTITGFTR